MTDKASAENLSVDDIKSMMVGNRLQYAREVMQLSVADVSSALHITPTYVNLIEKNQFQKLPAAIFTRGYIKSYARLVNLPVEEVMALYFQQTDDTPMPSIMRPAVNEYGVSVRRHALKWAIGFILFVLLLPTLAWWSAHRNAIETTPLAPNEPILKTAIVSGVDNSSNPSPVMETIFDQAETTLSSIQNTSAQTPSAVVTIKEAIAPITEQTTPTKIVDFKTAQDMLQIKFTGKCWIQVKNIDGVMLHDAEHHAGENISIGGKSPLYVWVKNANAVTILFNGEPVKIESIDTKGAARLVVGK